MRKRSLTAIVFLAALVPALMAPTGGMPSRPKFAAIGINTAASSSAGVITAQGSNNSSLLNLLNGAGLDTVESFAPNNGATVLYLGAVGAANSIINGSAAGDAVLRANGTNILLSANSGSNAGLTIFPTNGVTVGSPSGGDKGIGSINATGLYSGGVQIKPPILCTTSCNVASISVGQSALVIKGSNTSRTSNATFSIDPDLAFNSTPIGTYELQIVIASSAGAGGIRYSLYGGLFGTWGGAGQCTGTGNVAFSTDNGTGIPASCAGGTFNVQGVGLIRLTGAGTIGVQWAQVASNAAASQINATDSYMRVTRIN